MYIDFGALLISEFLLLFKHTKQNGDVDVLSVNFFQQTNGSL